MKSNKEKPNYTHTEISGAETIQHTWKIFGAKYNLIADFYQIMYDEYPKTYSTHLSLVYVVLSQEA